MIKTEQKKLGACANDEIKIFLSKTLQAFGEELYIIAKAMYSYPNNFPAIDKKESINDVFALIERSYIGILNNAIVRTFKQDATLQEFSVYKRREELDSDRNIGRADLLVVHHTDTNIINLLFEAKSGQAYWKKSTPEETIRYYKQLYDQAFSYYEAEKLFYTGDTYIITITFEWVRNDKLLKEIVNENYVDDNCTHYYYLYHTNDAGLMVYGNVTNCSI